MILANQVTSTVITTEGNRVIINPSTQKIIQAPNTFSGSTVYKSSLNNFNNNAKALNKSSNQVSHSKHINTGDKNENKDKDLSISNYDVESNLDLSMGDSFISTIGGKEKEITLGNNIIPSISASNPIHFIKNIENNNTPNAHFLIKPNNIVSNTNNPIINIPNSLSSTISTSSAEINGLHRVTKSEIPGNVKVNNVNSAKAENNVEKIILSSNSNTNNTNIPYTYIVNSTNNIVSSLSNSANIINTNANINNIISSNARERLSVSNLALLKGQHLENEGDESLSETIDSKLNKYTTNIQSNDIRTKAAVFLPNSSATTMKIEDNVRKSYVTNQTDDAKTAQNRIEILVNNSANSQVVSSESIGNRVAAKIIPNIITATIGNSTTPITTNAVITENNSIIGPSSNSTNIGTRIVSSTYNQENLVNRNSVISSNILASHTNIQNVSSLPIRYDSSSNNASIVTASHIPATKTTTVPSSGITNTVNISANNTNNNNISNTYSGSNIIGSRVISSNNISDASLVNRPTVTYSTYTTSGTTPNNIISSATGSIPSTLISNESLNNPNSITRHTIMSSGDSGNRYTVTSSNNNTVTYRVVGNNTTVANNSINGATSNIITSNTSSTVNPNSTIITPTVTNVNSNSNIKLEQNSELNVDEILKKYGIGMDENPAALPINKNIKQTPILNTASSVHLPISNNTLVTSTPILHSNIPHSSSNATSSGFTSTHILSNSNNNNIPNNQNNIKIDANRSENYVIKSQTDNLNAININSLLDNNAVDKKEEKLNETNNSNSTIIINATNNNLQDLETIRKSINKVQASSTMQKELIEKEELLKNQKKLDVNNNASHNSNLINNSESLSKRVEHILEGNNKIVTISSNNLHNNTAGENSTVNMSRSIINSSSTINNGTNNYELLKRNTAFQNVVNRTIITGPNSATLISDQNPSQINMDIDNITRKSAIQVPSSISLQDSSAIKNENVGNIDALHSLNAENNLNTKMTAEELDDLETRINKEKLKRNSGIFMKRVKTIPVIEGENNSHQQETKSNHISNTDTNNINNSMNDKNLVSDTNNSLLQEKLINKYLNGEEDDTFDKIKRNTNATTQNKLSLNAVNLNVELSKSKEEPLKLNDKRNININNFSNKNAGHNSQQHSKNENNRVENNPALDGEEHYIVRPRQSTDVKLNKKNIKVNFEDIDQSNDKKILQNSNKQEASDLVKNISEASSDIQDRARGNRVSGLVKRPNHKDLLINDKDDENQKSNIEQDNEKQIKNLDHDTEKDEFKRNLHSKVLKREVMNSKPTNKKFIDESNKSYDNNNNNNSEEEELEDEEELDDSDIIEEEEEESNLDLGESDANDDNNEEIKEISEEYESEELSENDENKSKEKEANIDDVYLNHILRFTEKQINKNKEMTEENSRKNSAITV